MLKRFVSLILVLTFVVGMIPMHVFAEEAAPPATTEETAPPATTEETAPPETTEETAPPETTEETAPPETTEETTPPETTEETAPPETTEETALPETTEETTPPATTEETVPEESTEETIPEETWVDYDPEDDLRETPEQMYEYYSMSVLYGMEYTPQGTAAGDLLTGAAKTLYNGMKPILRKLADGDRASSIITFGSSGADIALSASSLTAQEVFEVWEALRLDLPYETYWFRGGGRWRSNGSTVYMYLGIASPYNNGVATDGYYVTANTTKMSAAKRAEANAKSLVTQFSSYNDYKKMEKYAQWISDNVTYDHASADYGSEVMGYGAWTVVNVFDNDPSTNIVCGGYAKAFQYICDLSSFADTRTYYVTGDTTGYHAWNLVDLEGDRYLVDVTAYDPDINGSYNSDYFMAGAVPDADGWYPIGTWSYQHLEEDVIALFGSVNNINLSPIYYSWKQNPYVPATVVITRNGERVNGQTIKLSAGATLQLGATVYPQTASQRVLWHSNDSSIARISSTGKVTAVNTGTIPVFAIIPEGSTNNFSDIYSSVRIEVTNAVTPTAITQHPSSLTRTEGENAVFTVQATGSSLHYQWQHRTSTTGTWTDSALTGYNTASLTVLAAANRNGYEYRCKVTGADGQTVYSNAAKLTVIVPTAITQQPADVTKNLGENAVFTVKASGSSLKYQWQYKPSTSTTWTNTTLTGNKTASLTVQATANRNGHSYRCKVTGADGKTVYSNAAKLTVTTQTEITPTAITQQPANVTKDAGEKAVFTVKATGSSLKYQWQYRIRSTAVWADTKLTGYNTASLTVLADSGKNGYEYRCKVTGADGKTVYSNGARLYIVSEIEASDSEILDDGVTLPTAPGQQTIQGPDTTGSNEEKADTASVALITQQPCNLRINEGDKAVFTVVVTGSRLNYQWQYNTNPEGTWQHSSDSGSATASLTVPSTIDRNGYSYRCVITDGEGNVIYSEAVELVIYPLASTTEPDLGSLQTPEQDSGPELEQTSETLSANFENEETAPTSE